MFQYNPYGILAGHTADVLGARDCALPNPLRESFVITPARAGTLLLDLQGKEVTAAIMAGCNYS